MLADSKRPLIIAVLVVALLAIFVVQVTTGGIQSLRSKPVLYLTFDDGPGADTPQLLEVLAAHDIQATFFVTGNMVDSHPEVIRQTITDGHVIANHAWNHPDLTVLSDEEVSDEFNRATEVIEATAGGRPLCYRPPFGKVDERVHSLAVEAGLPNAEWSTREDQNSYGLWDVDTEDWRLSAGDGTWGEAQIVERLDLAVDQNTVLLHDVPADPEGTVTILERWLDDNGDRFDFRVLPGC